MTAIELVVMTFRCQISQQGEFRVGEHSSTGVGPIQVKAQTREEAINKLVREIRFWLELCPWTGETYREIDIEVVEAAGTSRH